MASKSTFKARYLKGLDMSAAIVGDWIGIHMLDNIAFQLKWVVEAGRTVAHTAADAVVAGTGTWRFDNGAFTAADVGGSFTVAGAANAGNNHTFVILTRVDATHVTTATTGLVNETFGSGVTMSLVRALPTGVFTVETSQDGQTNNQSGAQTKIDPGTTGKITLSGILGPVTLVPSTAGTSPTANASSTNIRCNQVEAPYIRLSYAPTTGGGILQGGFAGKGI